ncbi:MFS transporter [Brevibacillus sp. GCM10020057]|uniref:MFS transporter n=1 Tax=Brevibacillus sp. GCM10020057 TaxID=3317327 RepID=UPI00362E3D18
MKTYSASFRALWAGEVISEFGGAAGGIMNGLMLYQLTGSKEWMGTLWLVYFIPSLVLQGVSAPFLNHVAKEKLLRTIQLLRAGGYLLPLLGQSSGSEAAGIWTLVVLQCLLGLLQPLYTSLVFALLPEVCTEAELTEANGLLDGTVRLTSLVAPGAISMLLLLCPLSLLYGLSSVLFFVSSFSLSRIPSSATAARVPIWTRKYWWTELKEGMQAFWRQPQLVRLTLLSSVVQFAVGATLVVNVPFILGELHGQSWEYAIFSGAFPAGYAIGVALLAKLPKTSLAMYLGFIGGGFSFVLLCFAGSIPLAWMCELFGGMLFPLFHARSVAIFQQSAPRERLPQLSAVRLLFLRVTMPLGILFASSLSVSSRHTYLLVGTMIVLAGFYTLFSSASPSKDDFLSRDKPNTR